MLPGMMYFLLICLWVYSTLSGWTFVKYIFIQLCSNSLLSLQGSNGGFTKNGSHPQLLYFHFAATVHHMCNIFPHIYVNYSQENIHQYCCTGLKNICLVIFVACPIYPFTNHVHVFTRPRNCLIHHFIFSWCEQHHLSALINPLIFITQESCAHSESWIYWFSATRNHIDTALCVLWS